MAVCPCFHTISQLTTESINLNHFFYYSFFFGLRETLKNILQAICRSDFEEKSENFYKLKADTMKNPND